MIDLTRVTETRSGYKVLNTMYCPTNEESEQIVACIITGFGDTEEESETIGYFADGTYLKDRKSGMDLIENYQEEEPRIKQDKEDNKGIKQDKGDNKEGNKRDIDNIKQCMLAMRDNISVLLRELD